MCRSPVGVASWQLQRASEVVGFFNRSTLVEVASVSLFVIIHVVTEIKQKHQKKHEYTIKSSLCGIKHLSVNAER